MCGRFAQLHPDVIAMDFKARADDWVRKAQPAYNVAPSMQAAAVVRTKAFREVVNLTWGFRDPRTPSRLLINARSETAGDSPLFRHAWKARRCAVPVELFYEWGGTVRRPHAVRAADGDWLVLAGIFGPEGRFAILTGPASGGLAALHERSPIFLNADHLDAWLDVRNNVADVLQRQGQPPPEHLALTPLSRYLNHRGAEGPTCLAPPTDPPGPVGSPGGDEGGGEGGGTLPLAFG